MENRTYYEQQNLKNTLRIRELTSDMPNWFLDFMRACETTHASLTRLNYCFDTRVFLNYLISEHKDFAGRTMQSITADQLNALTLRDLEIYVQYLGYYIKPDESEYENNEHGKARKIASLRSLFKYLYKQGLISSNPAELLDMPCAKLPGYLNVTLTPSNPVIHTSRLYTLFQDYAAGKYYDRVPLFYEEWDEDSSRLLLECDGEVQQICKALPAFDLQEVKSLKRHYESNTAEELTRKIRSIEGFQGIKTPMVPKDGGYIPDLDSRYFTADFSYGLSILRQIGEFAGVATPAMTRISGWYEKIAKHRESFNYRDYGIDNPEQFQAFYAG